MELMAVEPIQIAMPHGPMDLLPGQSIHLPEGVGNRLLELAPGRVKAVMPDLPFEPGDRVRYRIPVIEKPPFKYTWAEHLGMVQAVDSRWEMVTVIPSDEDEPWRIVPWTYVEKLTQ